MLIVCPSKYQEITNIYGRFQNGFVHTQMSPELFETHGEANAVGPYIGEL